MDLEGLQHLMEQHFAGVNQRLDALTTEVKMTNGTVRKHDLWLTKTQGYIDALRVEIRRLSASGSGENRRLTVRDAVLVLGTVGATYLACQRLGLLK